ncbi:kinesin-like protein KIN-12C [Arachis duranensis]|uniref:Kinesin-like protein KIN-12C n=1 Tax=Arachis duranensis TaxID=130453 RepID=A0A6P4BS73_ARADU|nr:kinesin-like protein KIN-12C [Arachis duranensis]
MFKDTSASSRTFHRRNPQAEPNENEFESSSQLQNPINYPPPRTPLNSIPDPSQYEKEAQDPEADSLSKAEAVRLGRRYSERFGNGSSVCLSSGTTRASARLGKSNSEPNSAQSTPARNASSSRVSLGGGSKGRGGVSSCALMRGISAANVTELCTEVPHFELKDDPSFWMDHNVQVLIRIRPLSAAEKIVQGHGRCLKQESAHTLVWLGHPETRFTFDHVGCETLSQENLFRVAGVSMVENCLSGYNSCIFAYGQTGSGKTYTMMGEIKETDGNLTDDSGITPRVFDYLFTRIKVEEDSMREYKMKYSCKCSFLEIYNEQITDLLEPSSTNLQLREDLKKGVYVENLTEHSVETVNDVLRLLIQGAASRKVATTRMNCESSRSHSVFTCIIESRWEKDSMMHFRFARLNLVDLAGSERQKSSGADSERLKEAANINKSLSTLGLVIMSLVDLAHGKPRHVPYRDSRLTFLLQDSLGGNSKTMIIANVSPSICSAHETLSTLKFAQRAKLIQNNAKVNEDASGDINALQWQIQQLKSQLSLLMKNKNFPTPLSNLVPNSKSCSRSESSEGYDSLGKCVTAGQKMLLSNKEIKSMKAALVGALRREKNAEAAVQNLKAEIECLNSLARQREEDARQSLVMLRHCEEKIKNLELLVDDKLSAEKYLIEENKALKERNQLLQESVDRNTEASRLSLENDRLLQQLQQFESFYEHGERERLLAELSELRDQLLIANQEQTMFFINNENQDTDIEQEVDYCWNMNSKLLRDVDKLQTELGKYWSCNQLKTDSVETMSMRSDSGDEMPASAWGVDCATSNISERDALGVSLMFAKGNKVNSSKELETKLQKMCKDLEDVKLLNEQYKETCAIQLSQKQETEIVCQEVEMETTQTILHLQEEVSNLQLELDKRLCSVAQENTELRNMVAAKEEKIRTLSLDWEKAIFELTTFLLDGSRSLKDACGQVKSISCSFPQVNARISEHIDLAVRNYLEKEETILQLQSSLEEAQKVVLDMELKLSSLKEATVALSECQQDSIEGTKEVIQLREMLTEKANMVWMLENEIKCKNNQLCKETKRADAVLLVAKWLTDSCNVGPVNDVGRDISIPELHVLTGVGSCTISENKDVVNNLILNYLIAQVESAKFEVLEMENALRAFFTNSETDTVAFQTGVLGLSSAYREVIQELVKDTQDIRKEVRDLKMHRRSFQCNTVDSQTANANIFQAFIDHHHTLRQIQDQCVDMNKRLHIIQKCIRTEDVSRFLLADEDLVDADELSADSSSVSELSAECDSIASTSKSDGSTYTYDFHSPGKVAEQMVHLKSDGGIVTQSDDKSSTISKLVKRPIHCGAAVSSLSKELDATHDSFHRLYVCLSALLRELDDGSCAYPKDLKKEASSFHLMRLNDGATCENETEVFNFGNIEPTDCFLTKFMEVHETVKEADITLHALTKALEDSKQLTATWKQVGESLMIERSSLAEEIQKLNSSMLHKEEENQLLQDHIHISLLEMSNLVSMLKQCFLQVQTDVEKKLMIMYSDILLMGQEMSNFMNCLRLSLEDICPQLVDERFESFVLYNCLVKEFISKVSSFSVNNNLHSPRQGNEFTGKRDQSLLIKNIPDEPSLPNVEIINENMALKKELQRKQELLEGLLFDFRLLQESASNSKDIKDQTEKLIFSLSQVRYELGQKTSQLEDILVQNRKLEGSLADTENALAKSNYELSLAKESINKLSDQNAELRELLGELYAKKSEAEEQVDEHKEVIKGLEKEIANLTTSLENQSLSLFASIENELTKVIMERDQLHEEVCILNDKLEMASSLADEKEAIAMEARQESESCKLYAEQKEEEVKILEHSVEELESTINVLEEKVHDMDEEVGRHRLLNDSLEMELQALKERLLLVKNVPQHAHSDNKSIHPDELISRQLPTKILELHEALNRIKFLEKENTEQDKEIKKYQEYISELVLHAEAQALQYQQKYKCLESMFREVKAENSNSTSTVSTSEKMEKSSIRTRGSSSPFRCISNLVHQMHQEKEQELSAARSRMEELEALAASRLKEVCMLQTRLAAVESMTHDVIRDLLGVKLDITNYADLIDQNQIVKLLEDAHHQREEYSAKEKENLNLRLQINDLLEERESCISELKTKEADVIAAQIAVQQLQERDQLLSAQNEMLKTDKTNLMRKIAELDDMLKKLTGKQNTQHLSQSSRIQVQGKGALDSSNNGLNRRFSQAERLSRVNEELARYCKSAGSNSHR